MQMSVCQSVGWSVSFLVFSAYEANRAMQHDADEDDEEYDDDDDEDDEYDDEDDFCGYKFIFLLEL